MATPPAKKQPPWLWLGLAGVVVLALVITLIASAGGSDGDEDEVADDLEQVRAVEVSGDALPDFAQTVGDPAIGLTAPELRGRSFDGAPVEVARDGHGKLVVFLAHWCSHCQAEVPRIVEHFEDGYELPGNVDLIAVSTAVDEAQPNFPPSTWLDRERWILPVVVDDADETAANSFGLTGFPYLVALDPDGRVVGRVSGEFPMQRLEALAAEAAG